MHYSAHRRSGVSLTELLIALGILAVVASGATALIVHALNGWSSGASTAYASNDADVALQKLIMDLRGGMSASATSSTVTVVFPYQLSSTVYDTTRAGDTAVYFVENGLLKKRIGGTTTVLARGVHSMAAGVTGTTVMVTITSREQLGTSPRQCQASGRSVLRNARI